MLEKNLHTYIPKIGDGIFLTQDVAIILGLPYSKVRYWMVDFWDSKFKGGNKQVFGENRNRAVNFYTLIEFYTFYQLRQHGIKTNKILEYYNSIAKLLKTDYPFAHNISTDGKGVWVEYLDNLIKTDKRNQFDIKPFLEPFLKRVDFDGKNNIAQRFYPLKNSKNIVVDPKHQFGRPIISGSNIKAEVIYRMYEGGEPIEHICELYNVNIKQVKDALQYYKIAA